MSNNWYFSVQKALIYYTVKKSHHNSFILLVFSHVANFRYVANFTFLTLCYIGDIMISWKAFTIKMYSNYTELGRCDTGGMCWKIKVYMRVL